MHETIALAKKAGKNLLEPEALRLFSDYSLPVPPYELAETKKEAVEAAERFGYPVVLKVVSEQVLHKSDIGGVKLALGSKAEVERAYDEITESVEKKVDGAVISGLLVRPHLKKGIECIIGMTLDPQFGPAVMFGLGGIFVELLKDVSFRVLPMRRPDAERMISETKGYELLKGMRGERPKDIPALIDCLLRTAEMVEENPDIREIDINPLAVYEKGAAVLDARVML
ncbi:MAG: acetate--CoA ligase family protein [Spirochaetes bacterium]|nr:acetate--CoA ligase family protein [Spirochaetota bacterium]